MKIFFLFLLVVLIVFGIIKLGKYLADIMNE